MNRELFWDERSLVKGICEELGKNRPNRLKRSYKSVNLANRNFEGIWSDWFEGETPPKLEVDMILVFENFPPVIDDAFILAVETKYFKKFPGFYEGLGQVLSYSIFGFDGLSLWHLFNRGIDEKKIQNFASATIEVVEGLGLPMYYLCGKIVDEDGLKIEQFTPTPNPVQDVKFFVDVTRDFLSNARKTNPLLSENRTSGPSFEEIKKRRRTLRTILKIP